MDNNVIGRIHSIETFGTVDGPGIRFVVFMQGCHLCCKYCHNRDTWNLNLGSLTTVDELFNKIIKYQNYIKPSGGGVTVSGGEPLLQAKFLTALFTKLKQVDIHTTIDTSGMVDITSDIQELLKLTDLVLLDIKHIDSEKSKDLVGFSNEKELNFAKYLSNNNIPIWIRQVIIPTLTDDEKDLLKLKDFISSLKTVEKVELLAYHSLGKYKWKNLGFDYPLKDLPDATKEDIKRASKILGLT